MRYRFGRFELRPSRRELLASGAVVSLGGRAFDLLQALLERRDRVVGASELTRLVWPGLAVQPNNLQVQVWALRHLLGHSAIATVARRGYRFTQPVELLPEPQAGGAPSATARAASWPIESAAVCDALGAHPLVTLVGADRPSRRLLAHSVSRQLAHGTRAGVWTVEASALDEPAGPGPAPGLEHFVRRLSRLDALLVLLDAHCALEAVRRVVASAFEVAPRLHILATSRDEALGLPGERVVRVPRLRAAETQPMIEAGPRRMPRWNPRPAGR